LTILRQIKLIYSSNLFFYTLH